MRNGYATTSGDRYEHVAIAERALGRPLPKGAVVHHVNGITTDNRPENLVVCPDQAYHMLLHARQRVLDAGGHPDVQKVCGGCKELKVKSEFVLNKLMWDGRHNNCRSCMSAYKKQKGYNIGKFNERARILQNIRRAKKRLSQGQDVTDRR